MKRDYFQDERLEYEDIEIPDELLFMVRRTVAEDRRKKAVRRRKRILKTAGSVAAVLFLCLTIGVNSSYAFAEAAVKIPVVKDVAQAVVMRSYRSEIIEVYKENKGNSKPEKEPEVVPEQTPEEPVLTASDNNVSLPTEEPEQTPGKTESEQPEPLTGLEAWKAEMTSGKLREVTELYSPELEEKYADTPEKLRTILLAKLPKEDIALYGYHENGGMTGAVLRVGDTCQYFDWVYGNESGKLPELYCEDIDEDGTREVVVLLYNKTVEKKEISKEDIATPGTETLEGSIGTEDAEAPEEAKGTDAEKQKPEEKGAAAGDAGKQSTGEVSADGAKETPAGEDMAGGADTDPSSVSGNDVTTPTASEEKPAQPAGELWVVSTVGESWTSVLLSTDDYESQILHQLRAEYDAQTGELRLYLVEEPFGEPLKLAVKESDRLTYEEISLGAARTFTVREQITLRFRPEAVFGKEDGEKVSLSLERELEATIYLEDGSLVLKNIREV